MTAKLYAYKLVSSRAPNVAFCPELSSSTDMKQATVSVTKVQRRETVNVSYWEWKLLGEVIYCVGVKIYDF